MSATAFASQLRDDLEEILAEVFPLASILRTDELATPMKEGKLYLVLGTPTATLEVSPGGVVSPRLTCSITLYYEGIKKDESEDILTDAAELLAQFISHAAGSHPLVVEKWASVKDVAVSGLAQLAGRRGRHGYTRALLVRFTVFFLSPSV